MRLHATTSSSSYLPRRSRALQLPPRSSACHPPMPRAPPPRTLTRVAAIFCLAAPSTPLVNPAQSTGGWKGDASSCSRYLLGALVDSSTSSHQISCSLLTCSPVLSIKKLRKLIL